MEDAAAAAVIAVARRMKQRRLSTPASIAATAIAIGLSSHVSAATNLDPFARNMRPRLCRPSARRRPRRSRWRRNPSRIRKADRPPPSGASGRTAHPTSPRALRARRRGHRAGLQPGRSVPGEHHLRARDVPLFRTGLQSSALPQGRRDPGLHSLLLVAPRQPWLQRAGSLLLALLEPGIPHTNRRSFLLANRRPSQATCGHGGGALLANATAGRALLGSVAHLLLVDQVRLGRSLSGLVQYR